MPGESRTIRVEFFGIPRARAGVSETSVELTSDASTFAAVLANLATRFPDFGTQCVMSDTLGDGFAANVAGERFLRSGQDLISAGDTLLIFSADAGG
jgi:molybdopterin converting factor small subunit